MPSKVLNFQSPHQILLKHYPYVKFTSEIQLKAFACKAFVQIYPHQRSKLDPKAHMCVFVWYSSHHKGYKCHSPTTKKFYHTMNVTFHKTQAYYIKLSIQGENSSHES